MMGDTIDRADNNHARIVARVAQMMDEWARDGRAADEMGDN